MTAGVLLAFKECDAFQRTKDSPANKWLINGFFLIRHIPTNNINNILAAFDKNDFYQENSFTFHFSNENYSSY